jgi:DNA-binding NtrC family response regulator
MLTFKNDCETPRVLVVEDQNDCCESLGQVIRDKWHWQQPVIANTLAEAVLKAGVCDVALLDLGLPDCQPSETAKLFASNTNIPFVVITAQEDDELGLKCVADGAQDFVTKGGVDPELLRKIVLYSMERNHRQQLQITMHEAEEMCCNLLDQFQRLRKKLSQVPQEVTA